MLFDSIPFFAFFLVVYGIYLSLSHRAQNRLLLFASYCFYGLWDWRFLGLIIISTIVDYVCGIRIHDSHSDVIRKRYLLVSIATNLGILGGFKYFGFFSESLSSLLAGMGITLDALSFDLILPVGISFYTFQSLGYTIDIYRKQLKPCRNPLDFCLFIAFFPQLVAGPIERARRLIPQIQKQRYLQLNDIKTGTYLLFYGLFLKIFVADNMAPVVENVFGSAAPYSGSEVLVGLYAFSFQLLGDFAGYSLMAQGLARLMGFHLATNFRQPYFSKNIREFWTRWHVTLAAWFRDYVFRSIRDRLGERTQLNLSINFLITFGLIGFWHGASWTYVLWGLVTGLQIIIYVAILPFLQKVQFADHPYLGWAWTAGSMVVVYHSFCLGGILFRADSLAQSAQMFDALVSNFVITPTALKILRHIAIYCTLFVLLEWLHFRKNDILAVFRLSVPLRSVIYVSMFYSIIWFAKFDGDAFIYFQF